MTSARGVSQHSIYLHYIRPKDNASKQFGNRKETFQKNKVHEHTHKSTINTQYTLYNGAGN